MDNNITTLIKAIKFMNKKTFIPFFDDYVIVENGKIVLQDINKTYILKIDCLSDNDNFVFKKQYILDIQQKNSKYFLKSKNANSLLISVVSKELESEHEIPIEQKKMNHFAQMKDSLVCFNEIEFNGVNLKKMLKGHKDDITFGFSEEKLFISINDDFVDFSEAFGDICPISIKKYDKSKASISGQLVYDSIAQLGLVKKNPFVNIRFNSNTFVFSDDSITIYAYSNK